MDHGSKEELQFMLSSLECGGVVDDIVLPLARLPRELMLKESVCGLVAHNCWIEPRAVPSRMISHTSSKVLLNNLCQASTVIVLDVIHNNVVKFSIGELVNVLDDFIDEVPLGSVDEGVLLIQDQIAVV